MGGEYSARLAEANRAAQAELEARGLGPVGKEWRGNPPLHTFNRQQRRQYERMTMAQLERHFKHDPKKLEQAISVRSTRRRSDSTAHARAFTALLVEARRLRKQIIAAAQAERRAANRSKKEASG